jgi:pyruvyltransferase
MNDIKKNINLIYFKDKSINGNFGDELSKFITISLLNNKYIISYNKLDKPINLICIGSYIHMAKDNYYIYGSGIRTPNNIENGHKYKNLKVYACRGPLTKKFLENKGIKVPNIFGDPALLLPKFYTPQINSNFKNKIGIVPHKSNYDKYINNINIDKEKFYIINPTDKWENVINQICSSKCIISSSLHGLICSDAYNIPNLWLDEFKLCEGDFKFRDYFESQNRNYIKITNINEFNENLLYKNGNKIDLNKLINAFPFT